MSNLNKELVFLILQFLDEEGLKEAAHELERESGFYFDMKFLEEMVLSGNWKGAERYLSGFTKLDENRYSTKIYYEIRKQNFLEELDKNDRAKALDILLKDLKVFALDNEEVFKELTQLLTLKNIREHDKLSMYGDTEFARKLTMIELKKLIEANPLFHEKLEFPDIKSQRLRRLINQSLNWQHLHCAYPHPNPEITTLFVDHVCKSPGDDLFSASTDADTDALPTQTSSIPVPTSSTDLQSSSSTTADHSEVSSGPFCPDSQTKLAGTANVLKSDNLIILPRPSVTFDEEASSVTLSDQSFPYIPDENMRSSEENNNEETSNVEVPKMVARTLHEESSPASMEFHPLKQTVLLVGNKIGDFGLWDVISGEKLLSKNFKVFNIRACSTKFKTSMLRDPSISVNRITWSSEGSLFGVAYSKHLVHAYSYSGFSDVQQQLEIDAHVGGVNDLAFTTPHNQQLILTCGDDKTIKAWDMNTSAKMYTFEGQNAPVYSLCPHSKEDIHFIFSTSVDGKIKAWLYDNMGSRIDYDAPGLGCTSMAYSTDRRLFSCGTSKHGESFLVEWDDSEGSIKRIYQGLQKNSLAVVQFDIMKDRFLAAGDGHAIKIWDMDKVELKTTINVDGSLPANPHIRFNKDGSLLAVFADDNKIKILANDYGLQLLQKSENCSAVGSTILSHAFQQLAAKPNPTVLSSEVADEVVPKIEDMKNFEVESNNTGKAVMTEEWKHFEINSPSQCQTLWLPSHMKAKKISRLIYNNAGNAILALSSNAVHLFWKWPLDELNVGGKATMEFPPQLWQPKSFLGLMTNDVSGIDPEEAVPCFALSKNDSYLMSASGGKISLFNLITFKTMLSIMPSPPATTCLAFHPQDNNIIAIGRDDSTILIYNVRLAKVICKLECHSKSVSCLAFSNDLNVLVSAGADAQILVWDAEGWKKKMSRYVRISNWRKSDSKRPVKILSCCYTHVQFHQDQRRFLAVQERHLAIYEANGLECIKQWMPGDTSPISQATFSCDSQMIYACFMDGTVSMFDALNLELQCRIGSSAYLTSPSRFEVYPLAIAAHPQKPNQFAMGLTDGRVIVFEPLKFIDKWNLLPACENESMSNIAALESNVDNAEFFEI